MPEARLARTRAAYEGRLTARTIADRYLAGPQTPLRLQKAQALAARSHVAWDAVAACLPTEKRPT